MHFCEYHRAIPLVKLLFMVILVRSKLYRYINTCLELIYGCLQHISPPCLPSFISRILLMKSGKHPQFVDFHPISLTVALLALSATEEDSQSDVFVCYQNSHLALPPICSGIKKANHVVGRLGRLSSKMPRVPYRLHVYSTADNTYQVSRTYLIPGTV